MINHMAKRQKRRGLGGLAALALVVGGVLVFDSPPVQAAAAVGVAPTFPVNASVGQTAIPANVTVTNTSDGAEAAGTFTVTSLTLIPSCSNTVGGCAGGTPDPTAFALSATGTGAPGTGCAGQTFNITNINGATGEVSFTPTVGSIVLAAPNPANTDQCVINFTFSVAHMPIVDSSPAAGVQTNQVASVSGVANANGQAAGPSTGSSTVTVLAATPTVTTAATPSVTLGGQISDVATVSTVGAAPAPTGTVTFTVFGPDNATCAGAAAFTSAAQPLVGDPAQANSGPFTPTAVGTYRWRAAYSGDVNYAPVTTVCNDANETSTVRAAGTLTTNASPSVNLGGQITDTATLAAANTPTGTITFTLFGPNNATCSGAPIFTSTVPVNAGNGNYTSAAFTPTASGRYRWIAAYSGDANNVAVTTACNDPNEQVVVRAVPTVTTTATPSVVLGNPIQDQVTIAGGDNPGGNVIFRLFGPNNATCANPPVFTDTVNINGNGSRNSAPFTPTAPGTYRWTAQYSGDTFNAAVTLPCNDANETSTVTGVAATLSTRASADVPVGGGISDTATLAGGNNPTGSITFNLFGPDNATCTGAPIFTSTVPVAGNGAYASGIFTTTAPGTYRWIAAYSGDANNIPVTGACNDANESVLVAASTIDVVKTASPTSAPEPGGVFGFNILVTNTGTNALTITALVDDVYGDVTTQPGTCNTAIGTVLAPAPGPGNTYSCTFSGSFTGSRGDSQTDVVTVFAANPTGVVVQDSDDATVTLTGVRITTQASPGVVLGNQINDVATLAGGTAPTGTITFTLFGPDNATCTGPAIFTDIVPVAGNGSYPSGNFTPTAPGTYRWIAAYSGDATNTAISGACNDPNESVAIARVVPLLRTQASPSVPAGGQITDTATLTQGVNNPTGTITFTLFGPNNGTCAGAPAFTSAVGVAGNGNYTSDPFTTTGAGTWRWVAAYSGDANNAPVTSPCNDANENVVVTPVQPTITTNASGDVRVGENINDVATLADGINPTGTITFTLFGPDNGNCSGAAIFTSTVPVNGNGDYTSGNFSPSEAGRYRWIATYSGDATNAGVSGACNDPDERVDVRRARTSISTQASGTVATGGTVNDTATLSNGVDPQGNILFQLFGPGDIDCQSPPVFTSIIPVDGNGDYLSESYVVTQPGTYRWVAIYSGDGDNMFAIGACNDANESVNVTGTPIPTTTSTAPPDPTIPPRPTTTLAPTVTTVAPTATTAAPGATATTAAPGGGGGTTATTRATGVAGTGILRVTGANAWRLAKLAFILLAVGALAVLVSKRPRGAGNHRA